MTLRDQLQTDGFAVIEGFKSAADIAALRTRAAEIVDAFDPSIASGVFTVVHGCRPPAEIRAGGVRDVPARLLDRGVPAKAGLG